MSASELSTIVQSLLTLIVLALVIFWLWPEQRTDLFRQQMFALRDELFDFAADGKVVFDEPAYILLRQLMNGFIRYAHNLTPFRTWMSFLRWKYLDQESLNVWGEQWNKAIEKVKNQEVKTQLEQFHSRATMLVVSQLVLSPGLLVVLAPIMSAVVILHWQWTTLRTIYNDLRNAVPPMAFLEQEAANAKP
jgi:hypothetical protein